MYLVMFALTAIFVSSSMAGINMGLADVIANVCFMLALLVLAALASIMDGGALNEQMMQIPMVKALINSFLSVWLKALIALVAAPFSFGLVLAHKINSIIRRLLGCQTNVEAEGEEELGNNEFALAAIANWPWSSVLDKAILLGFLLISVQVRNIRRNKLICNHSIVS